MGNLLGKTSDGDLFDAKVAAIIKARAARHQPRSTSFQKLLLRFSRLQKGFDCCRRVFCELDLDGNAVVDLQELRLGCQKLGIMLDDSVVVEIFGAGDMDHNRVVDSREFIVVLALLYMFNRETTGASTSTIPAEIIETFSLAEEAFLFFDASKDGIMQKSEVLAALQEESTPKARRSSVTSKSSNPVYRRFAEMDWDNNGTISFKEWLFTIQSWVLDEEDAD